MVIRPITDNQELDKVYGLTHTSWVESGLVLPQPNGRIIHHPHLDASKDTTILVAIEDGIIVGTNSITIDGPSGLHVDHGFKDETDVIRAEGNRLASSWRVATLPEYRSRSSLFKALVKATVRLAIEKDVDTCLFLFPPKHESIYQRLINAKTVCNKIIKYEEGFVVTAVMMRTETADVPESMKV